jgi:hypothetical protein
MDLRVDAHSRTPIRRPGAEPLADVIEGGGLPRGPAPPRKLDGVGITPNAVARAIEDPAERVPPLHARLAAPEPSSIPRARAAPGHDV